MMGSNDASGRVCSQQTGGPGKTGMCMKPGTKERKRHLRANVGKDNYFFVTTYFCDEHAQDFDDNPPPGEKEWRTWKANPNQGDEPRDPYLGTKKPKPPGRKEAGPTTNVEEPKQETKHRPPSRNTGPKTPDHPTCTNVTMTGEVCCKPIARKFIGRKDPMFHLCLQCAKDLEIT